MYVKVVLRSIPAQLFPEFHLGEELKQAFELMVYFLKPASLFAFALASWRIGSDLGWTSEFLFTDGMASHWQLWTVLGMAMLGLEMSFDKNSARV